MNKVSEPICSIDVALELGKMGYILSCDDYYDTNENLRSLYYVNDEEKIVFKNDDLYVYAPSLSRIAKWLWDSYTIHVYVNPIVNWKNKSKTLLGFSPNIYVFKENILIGCSENVKDDDAENASTLINTIYETREEAMNAGILYALKYIIEK